MRESELLWTKKVRSVLGYQYVVCLQLLNPDCDGWVSARGQLLAGVHTDMVVMAVGRYDDVLHLSSLIQWLALVLI